MGFKIPDLIVESVLRDGLESVRRDPSIIDDVFSQLKKLSPLMNKKYGDKEIRKIKDFFQTKEISIVQAFSQVIDTVPCISIQLIENTESIRYAHLDDFEDDEQKPITDPERLAQLVILSGIEIDGYDPRSGAVYFDDSVNLANVHANHILVDADGTEFSIQGGIVNEDGAKQVVIERNADLNVAGPAEIKSSINFDQNEKRGVVEDEKLLLGIHTQERLLTIYLYILVKYFLTSRKKDLILRGLQLATYSGSDFTRNLEYEGNVVFSRFLTVSGVTQNNWISDKVIPIDLVDVEVLVEKDRAGNVELKREDATVKVKEED